MIFLATGENRKEPLCDPSFFCTEPNLFRYLPVILLTGKVNLKVIDLSLLQKPKSLICNLCFEYLLSCTIQYKWLL